ncbi:MAG: Smr/MutS family protein [Spirochaetes bacterium]|nr:Smr/MutS family protein [Spirochaetota bacterium]
MGNGEPLDFGDECDLHHFHPRDRDAVVSEFIDQASVKGLKRIRVIHGKGKSFAKHRLYELLRDNPSVKSWGDDGPNWGATVIYLK